MASLVVSVGMFPPGKRRHAHSPRVPYTRPRPNYMRGVGMNIGELNPAVFGVKMVVSVVSRRIYTII